MVGGLWIGPSLSLSNTVASGPVNILASLSWQAGTSTTLSIANGRARATSSDGGNPRIFKGPFQVTAGVTFRRQGNIYIGSHAGTMYARVDTLTNLPSGDIMNTQIDIDTLVNDTFTTVSYTGPAYFGIVVVVDAAGQYAEVQDSFSISLA